VTQINKTLVDEVMILQKTVKAQSQVHNELIAHLSAIDERRRNSRHSAHSSHSSHSGPAAFHGVILPDSADEPAPELRRAREILSNITSDPAVDREFERLNAMYQAGSPPDSATSSSVVFNAPGAHGIPLSHELLGDMRHLVYPAGQTAGIDPFHADHINNIPYTRPPSNPNAMAEPAQETPPPKEAGGSPWGLRPPRVLLVEDDKICAKIGAKFLSQIECTVDVAVSSEAGRWGVPFGLADPSTASRLRRRQQGQRRLDKVRPHLHGHHHARVRRRFGDGVHPHGGAPGPHHRHDVQHPARGHQHILPLG